MVLGLKFMLQYLPNLISRLPLIGQHKLSLFLIVATLVHGMLLFTLNSTPVTPAMPPKPLQALDIQLMPLTLPNAHLDNHLSDNVPLEALPKPSISDTTAPQFELALRQRTISNAMHEHRDAAYLQRWQHYLETFGNQHYPAAAQHLQGTLRLLVSIHANGQLAQVQIRQSSGHPELDQAAIALVHLAAPFEPFPAEIARDTDLLEIIRTWQFNG
jgi:TonB family protein